MITQGPLTGNEDSESEHHEICLGPYLGTRAVDDDQIQQALVSGLSVRECHDRLLSAECRLFELFDHAAWAQGWQTACSDIEWLATPANTEDIGIADLLEMAEDRRQELRCGCYASYLTTGTPEVDVVIYSETIGKCDCCKAGMLFVRDEGNDWPEIAGILRSKTDRKELREIAAQRSEDDYLNSRGRLNGLLNVLRSLQAREGGK